MFKKLLLLFILLSYISCSKKQKAISIESQKIDTIKICFSKELSALPFLYATEKNFPSKHIQLELSVKDSPTLCYEAMQRGEADIYLIDPLLLSKVPNDDYSILKLNVSQLGIVASKKARLRKIQDLKGRLIATDPYSIANKYCSDVLKFSPSLMYTIGRPHIQSERTAVMMLINNQIDAAVVSEPYLSYLEERKHSVLSKKSSLDYGTCWVEENHSKAKMQKYRGLLKKIHNEAVDSIIINPNLKILNKVYSKYYCLDKTTLNRSQKMILQRNKW